MTNHNKQVSRAELWSRVASGTNALLRTWYHTFRPSIHWKWNWYDFMITISAKQRLQRWQELHVKSSMHYSLLVEIHFRYLHFGYSRSQRHKARFESLGLRINCSRCGRTSCYYIGEDGIATNSTLWWQLLIIQNGQTFPSDKISSRSGCSKNVWSADLCRSWPESIKTLSPHANETHDLVQILFLSLLGCKSELCRTRRRIVSRC